MILRKRTAQLLEVKLFNDRYSRFINLSLILLISLNVLAIILESVDKLHAQFQSYFWAFELFSVVVFTIEYIARVWSSIDLADSKDSSPIIGRLKYMLTPIALIDLIAIAPFYFSLYLAIDLRFLRVLRLLRLFKLTRYSPALGALLDVFQKESETLLAAILVLLIMLIISASGIYVLENDVQPAAFGSIPDAMWWAIVTLTTVGYGDVAPMTALGKVFGGFIGLIGVGMVALPAAILASGFAENLHQRKEKYNSFVHHRLHDGRLDEEERWELEQLRRELGLNSEDALRLLDAMMRRHEHHCPKNCPHCGKALERRKMTDMD